MTSWQVTSAQLRYSSDAATIGLLWSHPLLAVSHCVCLAPKFLLTTPSQTPGRQVHVTVERADPALDPTKKSKDPVSKRLKEPLNVSIVAMSQLDSHRHTVLTSMI